MRKLFYRLARLADRIMKHLRNNSGEVGQITVTHEFGSLPNEMLIDSVAEWVAGIRGGVGGGKGVDNGQGSCYNRRTCNTALPFRERRREMNGQSEYRAGIYCRLSIEDGSEGNSASINTQKQVCEDFCKENHILVHEIFVDDGYSGANFDRPDFKRLLECLEKKEINTVVVKDLSRFGRNYVESAMYISKYFTERSIRFIAIHDNVDTAKDNIDYNMMFPFQSFFNEFYPMDCSKKVRRALESKAKNGEYIGPAAPYGYRRSASDKHVLEIDPETSPVVKRIFEMLAYQGYGYNKIARILSSEMILRPEAYKKKQAGKPYDKDPYDWNLATISSIVHNEVYIGNLVSGKRKKYSFKSKQIIKQQRDKWIIVPDIIPPIVSKELWKAAGESVKSRKRESTSGFDNIFAGLLKCGDCGYSLGLSSGRDEDAYYICDLYKKKGLDKCTCHHIRYDVLYDAVLKDVQSVWSAVLTNRKGFMDTVRERARNFETENEKTVADDLDFLNKELERVDRKIEELINLRLDGCISNESYDNLLEKSRHEREDITLRKEKLEAKKSVHEKDERLCAEFMDVLEGYSEIPCLDREILNRLIDRIFVTEKINEQGKKVKEICIRYKHIGLLAENNK